MSLITGHRQFHNYMSSVTYYLIIEAFIATFFVYDILSFHVHVHVHISVRFMFHIVFRFYAYSIWQYRYLYDMMPIHTSFMYSCPSMNLFFLGIGIIPIESSKLML